MINISSIVLFSRKVWEEKSLMNLVNEQHLAKLKNSKYSHTIQIYNDDFAELLLCQKIVYRSKLSCYMAHSEVYPHYTSGRKTYNSGMIYTLILATGDLQLSSISSRLYCSTDWTSVWCTTEEWHSCSQVITSVEHNRHGLGYTVGGEFGWAKLSSNICE